MKNATTSTALAAAIHRIVFAVAIGFLVLLVLGVLADVGTRSIASAYVDDLGRPQ